MDRMVMHNDQSGEFVRDIASFRQWVKADRSTSFVPEKGRYHLYVSAACPWSHRAMILRSLRKLEDVVTISITEPIWNDKGWYFPDGHAPATEGSSPDIVNHMRDLIDIYHLADPGFTDDETVPVLWDRKTSTIVCNESLEIMRMFDIEFREFGDKNVCLYPEELRPQIDEHIRKMYRPINNGVYRAGFATHQHAYERAYRELFAALDEYEEKLSEQRYLCGDQMTEADVCLFVTLIRFDLVYFSHFKCNKKRITDYHNLWNYVKDMYQTPGITETCYLNHIKRHYYGSHHMINPTGIIPVGPEIDFDESHDRAQFAEPRPPKVAYLY